MDIVLLLARLLLASIFVWSGMAKLLDRPGSRRGMRDFGVPPWLVPSAAAAIPAAELITAGLLVPVTTAWAGALTGLLLLLGFTAAVGYHLLRGRTPRCHCFGQAAAEPISTTTVLRNAVLVALAGGIVLRGRDDPGVSITGWLATTPPLHRGYLLLGCVAVALLGYGCVLLTRIRRDQLTSPGRADRGPDLELAELLGGDRPTLLVFTDPSCGACVALLPEIESWHRSHRDQLAVALVTDDPAYHPAGLPVLRQRDRKLAATYGVHGTPCAVVVGPAGDLREGPSYGAERIRDLVDTVVDREKPGERRELPVVQPAPHNGPGPVASIGTAVPDFALPDLSGVEVRLDSFRGRSVLLLFWDPGCGFCTEMVDELRDLDAWLDPAGTLLVLAVGDPAELRSLGLRAPVLRETTPAVGPAVGATGTPMAVLVDSDGRIASEVAAGAEAIVTLGRSVRVPA